MLNEKERESIKHMREMVDADIKKTEDKLKDLRELSSQLFNYSWDNVFKCPEGFDPTVCIDCKFALPQISETSFFNEGKTIHSYMWRYPGNIEEKTYVGSADRYCIEWRKKVIHGACGCGGELACDCGYWADFCYHPPDKKCPFCGKELTFKSYKQFSLPEDWLKINSEKSS